jgi:RHS repeat-associated protein
MNLRSTLTRSLLAALSLLIGAQALADRTTTYYHTDGLGSVVAATNEAGAVLWRKDYAPYGAQIDTTPETERTAYTGKQHDEVTGLTYFGARHFDPEIGRFMSMDPVGFMESNPLTFNRYAYANNNPFKFVDPDGRVPILIPILWGIGALMAADAANAPAPGDVPEPRGTAAKSAAMGLAPLPGSGLFVRQAINKATAQQAAEMGGTEIVQRAMSRAELAATETSGLLRGGRGGTHYVSDAVNSSAGRAQQRLALPQTPEVRVTLEVPAGRFSKPTRVAPANNMPGGGMERTAVGDVPVKIQRVDTF